MDNLKTLRLQRGWTQAMLEAETNHRVSAATISRIERGEVFPERRTQEDLAAAFGVGVEDISWVRPPGASRDPGDADATND